MKNLFKSALRVVPAACFLIASTAFAVAAPKWELIWSDEFDKATGKYGFDEKYWSVIERGKSNWKQYMSPNPALYDVKDGNLVLRGIVNPDQKSDPVPYLTGGIKTQGKFSFRYGKVEIRAKFDCAQGAWPALWMMPDYPGAVWPDSGEIDLMEHLNFDNFAYQTCHSHFTMTLNRRNPAPTSSPKIKRDDYNVYAVEWTPDELRFSVNGKQSFIYPRVPSEVENKQWPFDNYFYIQVDMQLGGSWVGAVNPKQLPVEMKIDWVRVYKDANAKGDAATKVQKYEKKGAAKGAAKGAKQAKKSKKH